MALLRLPSLPPYKRENLIDEVSIYTLTGKLVHSKNTIGTETALDIHHLSSGMYLIKTIINGQTIVRACEEIIFQCCV